MDLALILSLLGVISILLVPIVLLVLLYAPIVLAFRRQAKKHDAGLKYFAPRKDRP